MGFTWCRLLFGFVVIAVFSMFLLAGCTNTLPGDNEREEEEGRVKEGR
jgi:hypothetical protein